MFDVYKRDLYGTYEEYKVYGIESDNTLNNIYFLLYVDNKWAWENADNYAPVVRLYGYSDDDWDDLK